MDGAHVRGAGWFLRGALCCLALVCLVERTATAEIPRAAREDPRFALGYLVVTHYPGVRSDGTGDCTCGLQQAIDDAYANRLAVLFPPGRYVISDTLKCYKWQPWNAKKGKRQNPPWNNHVLIGCARAGMRPTIKLARRAPLFDDPEQPRPMVAFRNFMARGPDSPPPSEPAHPLGLPRGYADGTANLFGEELRNINFDCSGHPGAIAVAFAAAQNSSVENVAIDAEGAYAGFLGLPGRNGGAGNIEVRGGRFGLLLLGSMAGTVVVGATLVGQEQSAVEFSDFVPLAMVGFRIIKRRAPVITTRRVGWCGAVGTMSLVDGIIEVGEGAPAIDNAKGKSIYLRNVYIAEAAELVRSANLAPIRALGKWTRVAEYAYTEQVALSDDPPYELGDRYFRFFTIVNGRVEKKPQAVISLQRVAAPPADLLTRHLWRELPAYTGEEGQTIVITEPPYRATPDDDSDDWPAIQRAIDAAAAAGYGRVFVPRGTFRISKTLTLRKNTKLFGVARRISTIAWHDSWRPSAGHPPMIQTDDDPEATTALAFLEISVRTAGGGREANGANTWDRFDHLHWRAGRRSLTLALQFSQQWDRAPATNPRSVVLFSQSGGGKHYFLAPNARSGNREFRCLAIHGTRQPLAIYGLNVEATKHSPYACATNCELTDAENIRIFSVKREGTSPSFIIRDCRNVAIFSSGAMREPTRAGLGGYVQILGRCAGILLANFITQSVERPPNGEPLLYEAVSGRSPLRVAWPECITLYKLGEINDAVFAGR